jgi:hypothetical protein
VINWHPSSNPGYVIFLTGLERRSKTAMKGKGVQRPVLRINESLRRKSARSAAKPTVSTETRRSSTQLACSLSRPIRTY